MTAESAAYDEPDLGRADADTLVRVEGLKKYYPTFAGILQRRSGQVEAVDGVSFTIPKGSTFGLVGESGSGKTTLGRCLLRIEEPTDGTVEIDGRDVTEFTARELRAFRRNAQILFQDPTSSLNPRKRIKDIVMEPLKIHDVGTRQERNERAAELLETVDLPKSYQYKYPTSLSGGQKQRVGLARAIALNPQFIVLDEPTSALDVSVQARILALLERLQSELDLTYLLISHDISVVKNISDTMGVMYLGRLAEIGDPDAMLRNPQHPYTRALMSAIPTISAEDERLKPPKVTLKDEIPDPRNRPSGCSFRTRCPEEFESCADVDPRFYEVDDGHFARCLLHDAAYRPDGTEW